MKSRRGGIGSFVSMFIVTIGIVILLGILIIGSSFVKKAVQREDNFGIYNETMTGLDDVSDYMDRQFNNLTQLRIVVEKNGDWEGWLSREMER